MKKYEFYKLFLEGELRARGGTRDTVRKTETVGKRRDGSVLLRGRAQGRPAFNNYDVF